MNRCATCGRSAAHTFAGLDYCPAHVGHCPKCHKPIDPRGLEPCPRCFPAAETAPVTPPLPETPVGVTGEPQAEVEEPAGVPITEFATEETTAAADAEPPDTADPEPEVEAVLVQAEEAIERVLKTVRKKPAKPKRKPPTRRKTDAGK